MGGGLYYGMLHNYLIKVNGAASAVKSHGGVLKTKIPMDSGYAKIELNIVDDIISQIYLYENGAEANTLLNVVGEKVDVKLSLEKQGGIVPFMPVYIVTSYDNDKLVDTKICYANINSGSVEYTISDLKVPKNKDNATIKLFNLISIGSLVPYEEMKVFY